MSDDIEEIEVWLTDYDMDHLRDGQPVFKPAGEDTRLVLRYDGYDAD